ncbi:MAG: TetR/AcrR family transcriptional regulator [Candidatus Eremiobacteraeota bacterium]|nr:TetR/AcrR family transcriptional regulator [Candidatus Eremiobacteraeota bacterium]
MKEAVATPRGRPRSEHGRTAILGAANRLLHEVGLRKLTIEAVAIASSVGKPTIYRWWKTKGLLALDAYLEDMVAKIPSQSTEDASADFRSHMKAVLKFYGGPEGRVFADFIAEAQADPLLAEAFRTRFLAERRRVVSAIWQRGVSSGAFRADIDVDGAMDILFAPIIYRLLAGHAPLASTLAEQLHDAAFRGLCVNEA